MSQMMSRQTSTSARRRAVSRTVVVALLAVTAGICAGCSTPVDPDDPFLSSTTSAPASE